MSSKKVNMIKKSKFKLPREDMMRGKIVSDMITKSLMELGLNIIVSYKSEGIEEGHAYSAFEFELKEDIG